MDTVARISVNGIQVGDSDNMFRRYSFEIKPEVADTSEAVEVSVSFESPISFSERKFSEQKESYVVPPVCQYDGVCHANHVRKMQTSFRY